MFLETNSLLNSSNALAIFSTSAMCRSRYCGEKQPSCPDRTSHQFVVHVYISRYGKWTKNKRSLVFFSLSATLKLTDLPLSRGFNLSLKTLLQRENRQTETTQTKFSTNYSTTSTRWHYSFSLLSNASVFKFWSWDSGKTHCSAYF